MKWKNVYDFSFIISVFVLVTQLNLTLKRNSQLQALKATQSSSLSSAIKWKYARARLLGYQSHRYRRCSDSSLNVFRVGSKGRSHRFNVTKNSTSSKFDGIDFIPLANELNNL